MVQPVAAPTETAPGAMAVERLTDPCARRLGQASQPSAKRSGTGGAAAQRAKRTTLRRGSVGQAGGAAPWAGEHVAAARAAAEGRAEPEERSLTGLTPFDPR